MHRCCWSACRHRVLFFMKGLFCFAFTEIILYVIVFRAKSLKAEWKWWKKLPFPLFSSLFLFDFILTYFYSISKLLLIGLKLAYSSSLTTNFTNYTNLFVKLVWFIVLKIAFFLFLTGKMISFFASDILYFIFLSLLTDWICIKWVFSLCSK